MSKIKPTDINGVIPLTGGGTGATTAAAARTALGLGTIATQNANAVAITGGSANGMTIGAVTPTTGAFTTVLTGTGSAATTALQIGTSNTGYYRAGDTEVAMVIGSTECGRWRTGTTAGLSIGTTLTNSPLMMGGAYNVTPNYIAQFGNTGDSFRGFGIYLSGSGGTGFALFASNSSGYDLRFGIDGVAKVNLTTAGHLVSAVDGATNLGGASNRYNTVFATTGTINTSDEREKKWLGGFSKAELRAARRIMDEIGSYKWLHEIKRKKKLARIHYGVRAQRVFAILTDEGLEWQRYAWCCYDKWDAEPDHKVRTGPKQRLKTIKGKPAGDRYGIRPDELLFFLVGAQELRLRAVEDRLDALAA